MRPDAPSSNYCLWMIVLCLTGLMAQAEPMKTESRGPFLHNIPLHDADGKVISLPPALSDDGKIQEAKGPPFSVELTCGKCHDYAAISQGWHFNASNGMVNPGR